MKKQFGDLTRLALLETIKHQNAFPRPRGNVEEHVDAIASTRTFRTRGRDSMVQISIELILQSRVFQYLKGKAAHDGFGDQCLCAVALAKEVGSSMSMSLL